MSFLHIIMSLVESPVLSLVGVGDGYPAGKERTPHLPHLTGEPNLASSATDWLSSKQNPQNILDLVDSSIYTSRLIA